MAHPTYQNPIKWQRRLGLALFLLSFVLCMLPFISTALEIRRIGWGRWLFGGDVWDEAKTEDFLGVQIPDERASLELDSSIGRGYPYILLSFDASPEIADAFARSFCNGILRQKYDPFNAIDVGEPYEGTIFIELHEAAYYSYSPKVHNMIYGNRCAYSEYQRPVHIRVDRSNAQTHRVTFEYNPPCSHLSCYSLYPEGVSLHSFDAPFSVRGLEDKHDDHLRLINELKPGSFCIDVDDTRWNLDVVKEWVQANVQISVDGNAQPAAYITQFDYVTNDIIEGGKLTLNHILLLPVTNAQEPEVKFYDNYCFRGEWDAGKHNVEISINTVSGSNYRYEWAFYVYGTAFPLIP